MSFRIGQRVRIVRCSYPSFVGRECVLKRRDDVLVGGTWQPGWETDLRHPSPLAALFGSMAFGVLESQIVPLTPPHETTWEHIASLSNLPDFDVRETVRA